MIFTLEPIELTEGEISMINWVYSQHGHCWQINSANYPLPDAVTLLKKGLLGKKGVGNNGVIYITDIGNSIINSLPKE